MTNLKVGMILTPNCNNMEYVYDSNTQRLKITQIGMNRVFAEDVDTGEYLGEIGDYDDVEYYYNVVKSNRRKK